MAESSVDHDLLVEINTKLNMLLPDFVNIKDRVTALERIADKQSGFFSGAKMVWTLLGAIPPSIILLFFGVNA